jgi:pyruvate/2-oxoglutarate dehydrogenase complex dihydrolipoamide dehydrogenase (E3) component
MSQSILKPDLCVIGAGSGGLSVAAAAAAMGVPVVLVQKGEMGGDCLNFGCVPSKALIAAGKAAQSMRDAGRFGVRPVEPDVEYAAVHAHIRGVIRGISPNDSEARFQALGVKVIRAAGRFVSRDMLEAGEFQIKARRFVLATGSSPIPGLETVRFLTNESIFDLAEAPSRLVIVGGGPIGVELAQAYRRLGCDVTSLEAGRILAREDPELAAVAVAKLTEEGVVLREGVRILRVEPLGAGARVVIERDAGEEHVDASHLLIATGRRANVEGLGLDAAKVSYDHGGVKVRGNMRTTNRRIYAVGDVAGGAQFTHAANYHAGLALRATLFRLPVRLDPTVIPRVTYTDPEIAVAGLDEAAARKAFRDVNVLRWPFSENDRARAGREGAGHIKVVTRANGRILGVGIVGANAGELLGPWQLAMARKLKLGAIASLVIPYPTLSEVSRRAAIVGLSRGLRNPWLGRVLRFLRRFG